jgi:succinoglycan biosynthesis protein ExoL
MKIAFLVSHTPNPRIYKRMNLAKEEFQEVFVIYWQRSFDYYKTFMNDNEIVKHQVIDSIENPYSLSIYQRIKMVASFTRKSFKIFRIERPVIIHAEHLDMLFVAYLYKLIHDSNVKIVYEVADLHQILYGDSRRMKHRITRFLFRSIEKLLCKKVDRLIVTSPFFWDDYFKGFFPKNNTIYMANAPERSIFESKKIESKFDKKLTIGFIGAVRYFDQLRILIDAIKGIDAVDVFIAGDGKDYEAIKEYVQDIEQVVLYGSYDYDKEIAKLYERIDVVYSVYDIKSKNVRVALPNRLYEAIVTERPIIVAKGTRLADVVIELGVGFAVDSQDKNELKVLLENLVADESLLQECRENCRHIKDEYFADRFNDQLKETYASLISEYQK